MFIRGNDRKLAGRGWKPQVGLQEGIKDSLHGYKTSTSNYRQTFG